MSRTHSKRIKIQYICLTQRGSEWLSEDYNQWVSINKHDLRLSLCNYSMTTASTLPPSKRWVGHFSKHHWSWLEMICYVSNLTKPVGVKLWHWLRHTAAGFRVWCLNHFNSVILIGLFQKWTSYDIFLYLKEYIYEWKKKLLKMLLVLLIS